MVPCARHLCSGRWQIILTRETKVEREVSLELCIASGDVAKVRSHANALVDLINIKPPATVVLAGDDKWVALCNVDSKHVSTWFEP